MVYKTDIVNGGVNTLIITFGWRSYHACITVLLWLHVYTLKSAT